MSGLSVALRARLPGFELDVAWEIGAELAVLFGPSGAGKSLTLLLIAGDRGCSIRQGTPLEVFTRPTAAREARPEQVRQH